MKIHWPTLIAISALAYLGETFLHEAVGHGGACLMVGGQFKELNAFYVDCGYAGVGDLAVRWVAVAGPLLSFLSGRVALGLLHRATSAQGRYFVWLFMSIGFMTASGYFLFSGISGIGDWGIGPEGALHKLQPQWLWRSLIALLGAYTYWWSIQVSLREFGCFLGDGPERVVWAQRLALTSYLTGGVVSVLIGLFNPVGVMIVIFSAAAASLGGTSALAWEMQLLRRRKAEPGPLFELPQSLEWMVLGLVFTLVYAVVLGPSLKF